ncbi:MAG: sigma-70 family RNA polymerase sigma factor [Anaerolineae bacterium]|nr:sigma-70 family RNA polymerase sigma factor [Anaerolineae bacterium]
MTVQVATMAPVSLPWQRAARRVLAVLRVVAGWLYATTGSPALAGVAGVPTEDLILRFQRGQPRAFEALYDRYKDYIYRVAFSVLRNRAEAEDAVQETFLDLLKALPAYDVNGPARFETWLYRVALNRARMHLRRKRPPSAEWEDLEEGLERLDVTDGGAVGAQSQLSSHGVLSGGSLVEGGPERTMIDRETATALWRAVDQLPDTHRLPVLLRYREGFSYEEIAEALGVQLGTVKSRLYNAHKKLQRFLAE